MTLPVSWHGQWQGLSAVVLGLGKSGFSVVDTLVELGRQHHRNRPRGRA